MLTNESEPAFDAANSVMESWRPAELLNLTMSGLVGTVPRFQLTAVPQRLDDVLSQISVCARAAFARIAAIPSARILKALLRFMALMVN